MPTTATKTNSKTSKTKSFKTKKTKSSSSMDVDASSELKTKKTMSDLRLQRPEERCYPPTWVSYLFPRQREDFVCAHLYITGSDEPCNNIRTSPASLLAWNLHQPRRIAAHFEIDLRELSQGRIEARYAGWCSASGE